MISQAVPLLIFEEGYREKPYRCTAGYPTVGYGKRIGPKDAPLEYYSCFSVPKPAAMFWIRDDVVKITDQLETDPEVSDIYKRLEDVRKIVVISMAYQMGFRGCKLFKKMWAALDKRDFEAAALEMLDSKWARDKHTGSRASRHADLMTSGEWTEYYKRALKGLICL